jgi:uncharacterized protein (TIGR00290 family)
MRTQVALSWSGGKDSALAYAALLKDPEIEVVAFLTSITRGFDRISIHGVRRRLLEEQVEQLGLPLVEIALEPACTSDVYEKAFQSALSVIRERWPAVAGIAFGDLFLEDVRAYRERALEGSGFAPLFPLWHLDTATLARHFIDEGYSARLVCVDTTQLDGEFAGRVFDEDLLADLPLSVDPCGENGEFHTFVWDGPTFRSPVSHRTGEKVLRDDRFMYCDLE